MHRLRWILSLTLLTLTACGGRTLATGDGGLDPSDSALVRDGEPSQDAGQPDRGSTGVVSITFDRASYPLSQQARGTVHNGTTTSVFLPGCSLFNREQQQSGAWVDRGPDRLCGSEGIAVELKPGASHGQGVYLHQPGKWRLTLRYGRGCLSGKPLSSAKCAGFGKAVSPAATVVTDKATCDQLNKQYQQQLQTARKCHDVPGLPQCAQVVSTDLYCGCQMYVNNTSVFAKTKQRWADLGCFKLYPPCGIKCSPPTPTSCVSGMCQPVAP